MDDRYIFQTDDYERHANNRLQHPFPAAQLGELILLQM